MPNRAKNLTRYAVHAVDGHVGSLSDLYFDDESWQVRYLVVKSGGLVSNRMVLVPPNFVSEVDVDATILRTKLGKKQIEDGPGIESDRPVSCQQEVAYNSTYAMEPYSNGVWDPPNRRPHPRYAGPATRRGDPHLRSARAVEGYRIRSMDGEIGHVEDFIVDDEKWVVRYVVVDTRNWLPGKKVLVAARWISGVDWANSEVSADLDNIEIKEAPAWEPNTPLDRQCEIALHTHYGRPPYWIYDD